MTMALGRNGRRWLGPLNGCAAETAAFGVRRHWGDDVAGDTPPMQLRDGHLWLSPSDLSAHLACPYLTRLELESARGERSRPHGRDKLADLVARKGDQHEEAFLAQLRQDGHDVVDVTVGDGGFGAAAKATEQAMRAGADVIYQATFARDGWRGRADFLDPRRGAVAGPRRLELRGLGHQARAVAPSRPPCSS